MTRKQGEDTHKKYINKKKEAESYSSLLFIWFLVIFN